jgi:F0F1-type ATP synthase membrane subunit c/vacuolar-type H+-ATPase subunit K
MGFLWFPKAVLKALVTVGGAGLAGGPVRLCVSVLVEGVRERPSVFGNCWFAVAELGSVLG